MLNDTGEVVEGIMSNLFAVKDGEIITPDLHHCGVVGTMRNRVIELAQSVGWSVRERQVALDELAGMDELFVCNSLIGLWPVRLMRCVWR